MCNKCGKQGHKAANCRVHKQNVAVEHEQSVDQYEQLYNESKPHYQNSAVKMGKRAENESSERKLYKVRGFIDNIEATLCIDLGATGTIMNDVFVEKHGLITTAGRSQIMNADKRITAVESEVRCELRFPGSRTYQMNMMVMPQNEEWDVLLGNDFMEIDKPSILIADRKIVFADGTAVNFIQDDEQPEDDDLWTGSSNKPKLDEIYSAVEPDDPELFEKQWGDLETPEALEEIKHETKSKIALFKNFFYTNGEFVKKPEGYTNEEKKFMSMFRDISVSVENGNKQKGSKSCFLPVSHVLDNEGQNKLFELLAKNLDLFASDLSDLAGTQCHYRPFRILTDKVPPIYHHGFRRSPKETDQMKEQIDELIKYKMVRPSRSPWSFPAFLVAKPNNQRRLVIDYRELNKITKSHPFPMPRIVDIFDQMVNSCFFSLIDLKSGFNQVVMHPNSIEKTAFSTPFGHFEWTVLPFGLKNAPSEFCRMMYSALGNLPHVLVYLDDICIHTPTLEQHFIALNNVFNELKKVNLKINSRKVTFVTDKIKVLGHIISKNIISLDTEKVAKIQDRPEPSNVKELQVFLGICNFYRRFIESYAEITKPLTELLKKETKFEWSSICKERFKILKNKLCSYPILRLPDLTRPFILYTDASQWAVGAILGQKDEEGREYVCAYSSRLLKGAEVNYTITEKECLAVVFGIQKYRTYLYGTKFIIYTDHIALNWLMSIKDPAGRLCRWALLIQTYDFVIDYRKGSKHLNADTLSRPVITNYACFACAVPNRDIYLDEHLLYFVSNGVHPSNSSRAQIKRVEAEAKLYMKNQSGIWYRKSTKEFKYFKVPPVEERINIIKNAHLLGHFQLTSTMNRIKEEYYWYRMLNQTSEYISKCEPCQRNEKSRAWNHPAMTMSSDVLFDKIQIDSIHGLEKTDQGNDSIFIFVETMTGYVKLCPVNDKSSITSLNCFKTWVFNYGAPKTILTDRGTEFVNKLIRDFNEKLGIEHNLTAAYNPRVNGKCERTGQTLIRSLRKHCENCQGNWEDWLLYVEFSYNTKIHSTTGFSPYELVFGKKPNMFVGLEENELSNNEKNELLVRSEQIKNLVDHHRPKAIDNTTVAKERQRDSQNKRDNVTFETLPPETTVMVRKDKIIKKLDSKYHGPYQVVEQDNLNNYILKDTDGKTINDKFPLSQIKKIPTDNRPLSVVQKIVNHRRDEGQTWYLVKWKDLPNSENSWVNENDFRTKECIQKYLKNKPKRVQLLPDPVRTSTRLQRPRIGALAYVLSIIFLFFPLIGAKDQMEILKPREIFTLGYYDRGVWSLSKTKLPYCLPPIKKWPLNIDNVCTSSFRPDEDKRAREFRKAIDNQRHLIKRKRLEDGHYDKKAVLDIYTREQNEIVGTGYQCFSKITEYIYSQSMFMHPIDQSHESVIHLSPEECSKMVRTKECGPERKRMICEGKGCFFEEPAKPEYNWFYDIKKTQITCRFVEVKFTAEHADSSLFGDNCRAEELSCKLHDSIIIWTKKAIHRCPFRRILTQTPFDVNRDGFTSNQHNVNFIFHKTERHCNQVLLKMVEGVYILFKNSDSENFFDKTGRNDNETVPDLREVEELTMASLDFVSKEEGTFKREAYELSCKIFQDSLKMLSQNANNEYVKIRDHRNNEMILFVNNGFIYKPTCSTFEIIKFKRTSSSCEQDLQVEISKENDHKFMPAKLTTSGILIKDTSRTIGDNNCISLRQIFRVNDQEAIVKEGFNVKLVSIEELKEQEELHFANFEGAVARNHSKLLLEELNLQKLTASDPMSLSTETDTIVDVYNQEVLEVKSSLLGYVTNAFKTVLWIIFTLIILLITVLLIIVIVKRKLYIYFLHYLGKIRPTKEENQTQEPVYEGLWTKVERQLEKSNLETTKIESNYQISA